MWVWISDETICNVDENRQIHKFEVKDSDAKGTNSVYQQRLQISTDR